MKCILKVHYWSDNEWEIFSPKQPYVHLNQYPLTQKEYKSVYEKSSLSQFVKRYLKFHNITIEK
jgi:hypothetical protein